MAGGLYKAGDSFTVSLIFDEIVDSTNSRLNQVLVETNWGSAVYAGGADTNVLYFTGTVRGDVSGSLSVTGITNPENIKDMCDAAGTACTSKGGNTSASVDTAQPNLAVTSKGVAGGVGTATVKVNADQTKTNALRYAWSDSASMPATGWVDASSAELASAKNASGLSLSVRKEAGSGGSNGKWYLHVIGAYDTTGATTYKYAEVNFGTKSSPVSPAPAAPTLTASADNSNWATSRNISVAATNATNGTLQYRRMGTSAWTTLSLDSTGKVTKNVTENGYYTFRLTVGEHILTKDVLVEKIDKQAPTAAVGTPAESGTNQTAKAGVYTKITLPVTFSDSGSGVKTVQYQWTNTQAAPTGWTTLSLTEVQKQSGTAQISYTASESRETGRYLHIKVTDNVGNTVTAVSAVYKMISQTAVNNHAPKITLTGAPTVWTNDTATLEWELTNYSGKNYEVILPNGRKAKANETKGEVWARQNGDYTVIVRDTDYGTENSATVTVSYIDTTAPAVTVSPSAAPAAWKTTQTVTLTASDSQSGVGKKYYKLVADNTATPATGLTEFTSNNVSFSQNGVWYLYYKIYDNTGDDATGREANKTEGFIGPFKIDNKTPELTVTAPDKSASKAAGLKVSLKAIYGASGGNVKVNSSAISDLGATANDAGNSNDITKNATYNVKAKGTYQFVLTGGSGKTASRSLTVYEASFDLQGGTGSSVLAQFVGKDGFLTQPAAPTKTGYAFQGWYTAATGGEKWNFATGKVTSDCTFHARWETSSYTVTFNKNGGMIENESSFTSYAYGAELTLPTPTRTGYTFGGWYTDSAFSGGAVTKITKTDTGNKTYYAKWTPNAYTVTYDGNGNTGGSTSNSAHIYDTAMTLTSNGYERKYTVIFNHNYAGSSDISKTADYAFDGWNAAPDGSGVSYADKQSVTNLTSEQNGTVILYARWMPQSVTYRPARVGYVFAGWFTDSACLGSRVDENGVYSPDADITLYAKWTVADGTVTLHTNGGSGGTELTAYVRGTITTLPTDWTKTGYVFDGWYDNESFSGEKATEISATATGDKEYWAKWTLVSYTITYDMDGGTTTGNPANYTIESGAITLNNPTKVGCIFTGWSGTDLSGSSNTNVTIAAGSNGNRAYTAHWKLADYTVTLHTNGGTGGTYLTSYTFGTGEDLPTNWGKTGYTFDGWYDNESFSGEKATEISATAIGNKEYWAKWTDNIAPVIGALTYNYQPKNFWHWLIGKDSLTITVPVTEEGSGADEINYTLTPEDAAAVTKTETIKNGEAKIIVSADFKGTITIVCTDKAGNTSAGVTVGAGLDAEGIIIEEHAPQITFQAGNAVMLNTGEYRTAPDIVVTISDGKDNAISGGIASVSYKIGNGSNNTVAHDYTASMVESDSFTIPASEISVGETAISVTATDHAGNSNTQNYTVKVHIHNGILVSAVEPTCTVAGNKEYYTCSCGKWFRDSGCTNEITDKSSVTESERGHDFSGEYLFDTVGHWQKCSRCAEMSEREAHSFEADSTQCTVCDYKKEGEGHTHKGVLHDAINPTCTTKGNIAYYTCDCGKWFSDSACTEEVTAQDVTIPANGHTLVTDSVKPATCTETGLTEGSHCSVCGHVIKMQTVTAALGHNYGEYYRDAGGHFKKCRRCGTASAKHSHNYDNDRDTKCNDCGWERVISDDERPQPPSPTPTPQPPSPTPTPSPTDLPERSQPTDTPDSKPEVKQETESAATPEPTKKASETEIEKQPEGVGGQTVPATIDNGKIVISGETITTGNVEGMIDTSTVLDLGNGAVIVTVICEEQEYTAGVADTIAVANAVLTPEQMESVNDGETIEIRIDVKDISGQVPKKDKEVIESGIKEYRKEAPNLTLGMYVDISMFIRIGEGDWNAITVAEKPIEIIVGIPEKLQEKDRSYVIIRVHDGVHTLMDDMDDDPRTVTVSTDLFSSYAIAYVQTEGTGDICGLCHICPTFLGICYFIWLAVIILIVIVVIILLRKKKEK